MYTLRLGKPNFSLTAHGSELSGSPRWVIYLGHILLGALFAAPLLAIQPHWLAMAYASFITALAMKVSGLVSGQVGYNGQIAILDWLCDLGLALMWTVPVSLRYGHNAAAYAVLLVVLITWPWSEE